MATTVKGTDGKTYTLGSSEYTAYLLKDAKANPGKPATTGTYTDTKTGKTTTTPPSTNTSTTVGSTKTTKSSGSSRTTKSSGSSSPANSIVGNDGKTYILGSTDYTDYLVREAQRLGVPVNNTKTTSTTPATTTNMSQEQAAADAAAAANGSATTTTSTTTGTTAPGESGTNTLIQKLLEKITKESSSMISSSDTEYKKKIAEITDTLRQGQEGAKAGIDAATERAAIEVKQKGAEQLTATAESLRSAGPASSFAILNKIEESTTKSLRDLELRRQEALATGSMEVAAKIADMQLKEIEFNQKAKQDAFSNLLSSVSMLNQVAQEERLNRQQTFAERSAIANVALQYGLTVRANDTIDTIVARAQPFATQEQQLRLEEIRSKIAETNANRDRIISEGTVNNDEDINILAESAEWMPAVLGTIKDSVTLAKVVKRMNENNKPRVFGEDELTAMAQAVYNAGTPFNEALGILATDARINNKDDAEQILRGLYGKSAQSSDGIISRFFTAVDKEMNPSKYDPKRIAENERIEAQKATQRKQYDMLAAKYKAGTLTQADREYLLTLVKIFGPVR